MPAEKRVDFQIKSSTIRESWGSISETVGLRLKNRRRI